MRFERLVTRIIQCIGVCFFVTLFVRLVKQFLFIFFHCSSLKKMLIPNRDIDIVSKGFKLATTKRNYGHLGEREETFPKERGCIKEFPITKRR